MGGSIRAVSDTPFAPCPSPSVVRLIRGRRERPALRRRRRRTVAARAPAPRAAARAHRRHRRAPRPPASARPPDPPTTSCEAPGSTGSTATPRRAPAPVLAGPRSARCWSGCAVIAVLAPDDRGTIVPDTTGCTARPASRGAAGGNAVSVDRRQPTTRSRRYCGGYVEHPCSLIREIPPCGLLSFTCVNWSVPALSGYLPNTTALDRRGVAPRAWRIGRTVVSQPRDTGRFTPSPAPFFPIPTHTSGWGMLVSREPAGKSPRSRCYRPVLHMAWGSSPPRCGH